MENDISLEKKVLELLVKYARAYRISIHKSNMPCRRVWVPLEEFNSGLKQKLCTLTSGVARLSGRDGWD